MEGSIKEKLVTLLLTAIVAAAVWFTVERERRIWSNPHRVKPGIYMEDGTFITLEEFYSK